MTSQPTTDPATPSEARGHDRRRPDGPPLAPVALVTLALTLVGVVLPTVIAGETYPSPFGDGNDIIGYVADHPSAVTASAFLAFASSIPLAIYAAVASTRLNRLGARVPGPTIALAGGLLASVSLASSGLVGWVLARPEIRDTGAPMVRALHDLTFVFGGPGFVVPLGLLLAGIAVPSLLLRLLPAWLAWTGLVLAAICELATFTLLASALMPMLPAGRFLGLIWLVVVGFRLPRRRAARASMVTPVATARSPE